MIIPVRKSTIQGWEPAIKFLQRCLYTIPAVSTTRIPPAYLTGPDHPMTTARIFKPAKNAMQSGTAKTKEWQVDFEPEKPREIEPLMGWTSSSDMKQELSLRFDTKEEAVAYCEREGIPYQVFEPKEPARRQAAYADNFAFRRVEPWTH
jgi:ETC complex I subunit conserved region